MTDPKLIAECGACGAQAPRGAMFGVEGDLRCDACAAGVRQRLHVNYRPLPTERTPRATALCLAIALALFVCTAFIWRAGTRDAQPAWIQALYQDWSIWAGAVWKHVTSMFLHIGIVHMLFNGMALWTLGRAVESSWGTPAFLALFLGTGMAGSALEWIASGAGSVGLSGGICGLAGFLIARRRDHPVARAVMHDGNVRFLLGFLVVCVLITEFGGFRIANWAHGGGLLTGWLLGLASRHAQRRALLPAAAMLCAVFVVASVFLAFGTTQVSFDGRKTWVIRDRQAFRAEWLAERR
ncbi:MAG: rhomboid family intramembrane serine protease [Planctomycetota bacterium]|nr:rhomboid family intramembrane serine protease [Planctomycetota bacterium]